MAVAFDAVGGGVVNGSYGGGAAKTWSHTVSAAPNVAVILGFGIESLFVAWASYAPTAVTFGGQAMTHLGHIGGNNSDSTAHVALYGLLNPTNRGTQTVSITPAGGAFFFWSNSASYTGVASLAAAVTNAGSSTAVTTGAKASAVGRMMVSQIGIFGQNVSAPTQTVRASSTVGSNCMAGYFQDAPGAATVTSACTGASATAWAAIAVDLLAAPDPAGMLAMF